EAAVIEGKAASGYDGVNVRVIGEVSPPRVENKRCADRCHEAPLTETHQCIGDGAKEQAVHHARRKGRELPKLRRQCKYDVKVGEVERASTLRFYPASLGQALTLWTMAIPARVVHGALEGALRAPIPMAAEFFGPALGDVRQHALAACTERT